jgi:hypothetical protein
MFRLDMVDAVSFAADRLAAMISAGESSVLVRAGSCSASAEGPRTVLPWAASAGLRGARGAGQGSRHVRYGESGGKLVRARSGCGPHLGRLLARRGPNAGRALAVHSPADVLKAFSAGVAAMIFRSESSVLLHGFTPILKT